MVIENRPGRNDILEVITWFGTGDNRPSSGR
jgi:hypothetical protein